MGRKAEVTESKITVLYPKRKLHAQKISFLDICACNFLLGY
jgi:hypothetical protein